MFVSANRTGLMMCVLACALCACDPAADESDAGAPPVTHHTHDDAGAPAPKPKLGKTCTQDSQCPSGAFCSTQHAGELFGGTAAVGTCVADCASSADACDAFEGAVCVGVSVTDDGEDAGVESSAGALCFASCTVGKSDSETCGGQGLACAPLTAADPTHGFCRPICASDGDCGRGVCDPRHGVCRERVARDTTFGRSCHPDGEASCDGLCVSLSTDFAECSRRCVFGATSECAPASGGLRRGGCLFTTPSGGLGDLGYCGELCDCKDDCTDPNAVCDAFEDADLENAFGRKGVCTAAKLVMKHALACKP
jgi:hypothetical protein